MKHPLIKFLIALRKDNMMLLVTFEKQ